MVFICSLYFVGGCKAIKFEIHFVVEGEVYSTVETSGNDIIQMPENPTKEGYEFAGWFWDEDVWENPLTVNSLLDVTLSSDMNINHYSIKIKR